MTKQTTLAELKRVQNDIVGAFMKVVGTVWGINATGRVWTDDNAKLFNNRSVDIRDDLLEKVSKTIEKAVDRAVLEERKQTILKLCAFLESDYGWDWRHTVEEWYERHYGKLYIPAGEKGEEK